MNVLKYRVVVASFWLGFAFWIYFDNGDTTALWGAIICSQIWVASMKGA